MPRAGGATLKNNTFTNNIISGSTTVYDLRIAPPNGTDISDNKSNYNNVHRSGQPLNLAAAHMVYTLEAWRELTGNDINSISADPAYLSPGSPLGYAVANGSPVIDTGTNLSTLVVADYRAAARPQGVGYDMGAFEKGDAVNPPPPPIEPPPPPPPPPPPTTGKDTSPPVVTLVGLAPTAVVSSTIKIAATATDNVGVVGMSISPGAERADLGPCLRMAP